MRSSEQASNLSAGVQANTDRMLSDIAAPRSQGVWLSGGGDEITSSEMRREPMKKMAKNYWRRKWPKSAQKVMPANPYIFTNGTFHEIGLKPLNDRARLRKSGFDYLCEIDQKVKGTPFARFSM